MAQRELWDQRGLGLPLYEDGADTSTSLSMFVHLHRDVVRLNSTTQ